tara:strand:+ start:1284 stop:1457 length:174 start_codon:yes stop_codon:yes gene_type:complete
MNKPKSWTEKQQEEGAKTRALVERAKAGDREAVNILAAAPYRMRVYTNEEIETFQGE